MLAIDGLSAAYGRARILFEVALEPGKVKAQRLFQPLRIGRALALVLLRLDLAQEQAQQHGGCRQHGQQARQPEQGHPPGRRSLAGVRVGHGGGGGGQWLHDRRLRLA